MYVNINLKFIHKIPIIDCDHLSNTFHTYIFKSLIFAKYQQSDRPYARCNFNQTYSSQKLFHLILPLIDSKPLYLWEKQYQLYHQTISILYNSIQEHFYQFIVWNDLKVNLHLLYRVFLWTHDINILCFLFIFLKLGLIMNNFIESLILNDGLRGFEV